MTITEANCVNALIDRLFVIPDRYGGPELTETEVRAAASYLAERAHKALMAGVTSEEVDRADFR